VVFDVRELELYVRQRREGEAATKRGF